MTLRTFLFFSAIAAIVPILLLALGATCWAARAERARELLEFNREVLNAANSIEIFIRERFTLVRTFARTVERLGGDRDAIAAAAREVHAATGIDIVVATVEGRQIVNTTVPQGFEATLPPGPGVARRAMELSDAFLTDIYPRPRGTGNVAVVAVAARPRDSAPWGVGAIIEPARLTQVLPVPRPVGAFAAVFDSNGMLAAIAPQDSPIGERLSLVLDKRGKLDPSDLHVKGMRVAFAPVPGTSWRVAVGVPDGAPPVPADKALRWILQAGVIGIVITALFAALLAKLLLRQVRVLVAGAGSLEGPPILLPGLPIHEFGLIREALIASRVAFQERRQQVTHLTTMSEIASRLEATVAERTIELERTVGRLLKAEDDERRRIARDLHDSTVQELHAAAMLANVALTFMTSGRIEDAKAPLVEVRSALDRAREELRTLTYLLQPPLLDECGLPTALRVYAEGFARRSGLHITADTLFWTANAPRAIETMLFRVAQEALANVYRHAKARRVVIHLFDADGLAVLTIADDGQGMEKVGALPHKELGVGIPGMRARLRQVSGELSIISDQRGTRLVARAPLHDDQQ